MLVRWSKHHYAISYDAMPVQCHFRWQKGDSAQINLTGYLNLITCSSYSGLMHSAYLCLGHDLGNTHITGHGLHSENILYLSVVVMRQTATGDLDDNRGSSAMHFA